MTYTEIKNNPIEKKDLKLIILQSQGYFEACQSEDGKRFYLLATYKFDNYSKPKVEPNYFYYIAKAIKTQDFRTKELMFYFPVNTDDLKDFSFYSIQSKKKVSDGYINYQPAYVSDFEVKCSELIGDQFNRVETFQAAEKCLKSQQDNFKKKKKGNYHCGTSNKDMEILRKQYLLKQKAELEEANKLTADVL